MYTLQYFYHTNINFINGINTQDIYIDIVYIIYLSISISYR